MKVYETQLSFSGATGHAVIVESGQKHRLVLWSKAQYVPCLDLGGDVWFTPEWLETNSPEDNHCYEPIMYKKLKFSRASILEANDVRGRVRWEYACADMRYRVFHGNTTAEEVYTMFHDGVAVRKLTAYPGDQSGYGANPNMWQVLEWIIVNGAGTTPDSTLRPKGAFELSNEKGESISLDWPIQFNEFKPLCTAFPQIADWNMYIGRVNFMDRPSPYVIFAKDQRIFAYRPCGVCGKNHPYFNLFSGVGNVYKHWPATDAEDFVLAAKGNDVVGRQATHSSFIDCNFDFRPSLLQEDEESQRVAASYYVETPPRGTSWLFLVGATDKPTEYLRELAVSWYRPATVLTGNECIRSIPGMSSGPLLYEGFAYSERAYVLRSSGAPPVEFSVSPKYPMINPVFIINGWKSPHAAAQISGAKVATGDIVQAVSGDDLVLMVTGRFEKEISVRITAGA
jgi:hypothetical protein